MAWLRRLVCVLALAAPLAVLAPPLFAAVAPATGGETLVYTLPPAKLALSRSLYYWRTAIDFGSSLWSILILLALLKFRLVARLRNWAAAISRRKWLQGLCFLPALLLIMTLLFLPLGVVAHHVSLKYGQSIQGWGSWFLDWAKALLLNLFFGTLVLSVIFAVIRASRRWWLWIWLLSLPAQLLVVFVLPVVIDPLFNHFEPLSRSNPALVEQLERVVARTGMQIPPSRMFLMRASEKVTSANAYVTGFGASKRVVVWDTAIKSAPTDEILVIFGHELGHYVLNHIRRGLILSSLFSLVFIWIGFQLARFLIRRYGPAWDIASLEDWGAAAILLLLVSILSFAAEPLANAISRAQEHQADVFGEEVVHGVVADPQTAAANSFQHLGEQALDYPYPNRLVVFWSYSHPTIAARESFAVSYDPWRPGEQPRYFTKDGRLRKPSWF